eukprot:210429_1
MKRNTIRFTPIQVEAIKSGMHYGLSVVVGPPGSGKTDVAVQIISNLYAKFGDTERILLVTHSNSALDDLFCKLMGDMCCEEITDLNQNTFARATQWNDRGGICSALRQPTEHRNAVALVQQQDEAIGAGWICLVCALLDQGTNAQCKVLELG